MKTNNCFSRKIIAALILLTGSLSAQTFPPGFSQVQIPGIYYPTSMAFANDGRIFVTEKAGKIKIVKNGSVLPTPFLLITVDQLNERGLSSVILDPDFDTNHYLYVYYTTSTNIHNRLSRFTANGDVAVDGSEKVILDFEPVVNSIHNSGGMAFGLDGTLYLAVGNDDVNSNSQDLNTYKGKVLHINTDGSVPPGNPFTGSEPAKRIWAYGLRNPWTLAIQRGTGRIFANDVGEATWEEINDITVGGKNFGWPGAEGMSSNPAYTNPIYTYHHGTSGTDVGCAITGGTFFNPVSSNYPAEYTGKYFFIDYCNHWINYLDLSNGVQKNNFATQLAGACNYIKEGNDGNLYYFSISQNSLYKIIYSSNNSPVVTTQPSNKTVPQGQPATFSITASGATPLNYQWRKNTAAIPGANSASYTITSAQPADTGQYSVVVSNGYGSTTSNNAVLTVTAFDAKPTASILTPVQGTLYRSGDIINFSGDGNDLEDGNLPASAFNWFIQFHHDQHYHPGPNIPPGVKSGSFNTTFGEASANVFFRLFLVVADSHGLTDTTFRDIHPVTSTLTLASQPPGLQLLLDGQPHVTNYSVAAVSGMTRTLGVITNQTLGSTNYTFDHWQQGGPPTQDVHVTDSNQTFTAIYKVSASPTCTATGTINRDYWANITGFSVSDVPVNSPPTSSSVLTIFEGPSNVADNYGSRIRGYICPPATGNYTFWIASDNSSELWLSTNDNPVNKIKIASVSGYTHIREWTKYPTQQSAKINLTAGMKYYIEAIHKESTQGDNLAVGWQLPDGTMERPIPGTRLSPYTTTGSSDPVVTITSPANNTTYSNPSNITINANAISPGSIQKVEFFQGATKIGECLTSPYSITWMNVTTGSYTLKAVATDNMNKQGTSQTINVSVASCSTPIITASGPTTFCSGTVTLNTNTAPGNLYQWKKDGVNIPGATASSYTASASGDYQVKVIQGSCISWSAPAYVRIKNGLSASITPGGPTTICPTGNVVLYANTCNGYSYQWKKDNIDIPGAMGQNYTATAAGNYQVRITQNSVNAWSSLVNVQVVSCKGYLNITEQTYPPEAIPELPNKQEEFNMRLFPNPTNGLFTMIVNMATASDEKIKMKIINLLGAEIYNREFTADNGYLKEVVELDKSLPTGVYTLQVLIGDKIENTNLILSQ